MMFSYEKNDNDGTNPIDSTLESLSFGATIIPHPGILPQ